MPLFRCDECGCIENTALGFYWSRNDSGMGWPEGIHGRQLCSEHGPTHYKGGTPTEFGKWHGEFPKRSADGMLIDQDGFLWTENEVAAGMLPKRYRIVGKVADNKSQADNSDN